MEEDNDTDEWWMGEFLIYGFNEKCKNIASSYLKIGDDSMSAIRFQTTAKRELLHLSYIFRDTEPLGGEFNAVTYSVTGSFIFIEIYRGK